MNVKPGASFKTATLFLGLIGVFSVTPAQSPRPDPSTRRVTVQSELDYLRAGKLSISIDLPQATIRQAYDGIAAKGGFVVAYEGAIDAGSRRDLTFRNAPVKEILGVLAEQFDLSYRVDGPTKLTVIGRHR